MELAIYLLTSVVLALLFYLGLRRFDGPKIPDRIVDDIAFGPASFGEREQFMHAYRMRRMLSGSLFRAGWLLIGWGGTGVLFFTGDNKITGVLPAAAFGLPWGFGLAVAIYNIHKWLDRM